MEYLMPSEEAERLSGEHITFSFGKNWRKYLDVLDESRIHYAQQSFTSFTGLTSLQGYSFLDVGCGSGLSSLIAYRLGTKRLVSVDIDNNSIECVDDLRRRFKVDPETWAIRQGSILDKSFVESLGRYSYVYSWGVLHHTGAMWDALENTIKCVAPGGTLHIALYNKHRHSPTWLQIKRICNRWPHTMFPLLKGIYALYANARVIARVQSPSRFLAQYKKNRGMDHWRDIEDWLGGLPYEFCRPNEVVEFLADRRFVLIGQKITDTKGCNEFLFRSEDHRGW
jgi:2-polyprenyl-6-hydroxyphenyl methylase/3-demethylubiquinone-9 3-methyltransferase